MSCRTSNIDDEFIRSAGGGATSQNKTPHRRPRASGANQPQMQTAHHHRCAVDTTTKQGRGIPVGNVSAAAILRACVLQAKLVHSTGGGRNNNRCSSPSHNIYNNTSNQHRSAEKIYSSPLPPHPSKNIKIIQEILQTADKIYVQLPTENVPPSSRRSTGRVHKKL